jgi:hypothetical protein
MIPLSVVSYGSAGILRDSRYAAEPRVTFSNQSVFLCAYCMWIQRFNHVTIKARSICSRAILGLCVAGHRNEEQPATILARTKRAGEFVAGQTGRPMSSRATSGSKVVINSSAEGPSNAILSLMSFMSQ